METHDNMLRGKIGESVNCVKKGSEMIGFVFGNYHFDHHVENRIYLGEAGDGETTWSAVAIVKVRDDDSPYKGRRNKIGQRQISDIFKIMNRKN